MFSPRAFRCLGADDSTIEIAENLKMIWVFPKNRGFSPKWMVKIMENIIKMDDLGVTLFSETSICPKGLLLMLFLLGRWLNFKLFGIICLVWKIKF